MFFRQLPVHNHCTTGNISHKHPWPLNSHLIFQDTLKWIFQSWFVPSCDADIIPRVLIPPSFYLWFLRCSRFATTFNRRHFISISQWENRQSQLCIIQSPFFHTFYFCWQISHRPYSEISSRYFLIFATFQYTLLPTQNFAPAAIPICVAVCLPEFNIFCNPAVSTLNASEDELGYDVVFLIINTSAFCLISHCLMCFFMVLL